MNHLGKRLRAFLRPASGAFSGSVRLALPFMVLALAGVMALPGQAKAKYASLIMDANSGKVLHAVNAETRNYPASLTKIMTLYMMFEAIDSGRLHLYDRIVFSRRAARQPASKLGLKAGQSLSAEEAILALTVKSANDVASAVAEHLGGTERNFALMMTSRARKLGMNDTTFRNASGLPHRSQMTTARDMATLARAVLRDFPHRYGYFSETRFRHNGKIYQSHNSLLKSYKGADGIKTGYIRASGFQLVTSVKRGKHRLIGVVLGGRTARVRNVHMATLLNKSFAKLDKYDTQVAHARPVKSKSKKPVGNSEKDSVQMVWGVQVGAYRKQEPAKDMALKAIEMQPELLAVGKIAIAPLKQRSGRVLYRARILGIERSTAYRACKALKRQKVACMELQTQSPIELAMR